MKLITHKNDRRKFLGAGVALAGAGLLGVTSRSFAAVEDVEAAIATFADGAELQEGGLTLNTPEIAENGNSVPVAVTVDSPMKIGRAHV